MRRREFITLIGGVVAAWPLAARAQQPAMPVVGILNNASPSEFSKYVAGFRLGLRQTGYVEGQNVSLEFRWAEGRYERLKPLAQDLVRRRPAVIFTIGAAGVRAVQAESTTIPVVFTLGDDPVAAGLVSSMNRPGGNVTGISHLTAPLGAKRLEMISELVPKARVSIRKPEQRRGNSPD
jgi:putative tryptophan/tyrosine transport system substrate-binding protein